MEDTVTLSRTARTDLLTMIKWGVAHQSFDESGKSGDQYLLMPISNGVLVAVADALGHGPKASLAGEAAIAALEAHANESLVRLFEHCHNALRRTRGVVMSAAILESSSEAANGCARVMWLGVGNVAGLVLSRSAGKPLVREHLLSRGGIVGYNLPTLRPVTFPLYPNDTLIFATDGLRSNFGDSLTDDISPQQLADRLLANHYRGTDDALVLALRYSGPPSGSSG